MKGGKWVGVALAILSFGAAVLILDQQYVMFGEFFQLEDVHHESFAMSAAALGFGILIGVMVRSAARINCSNIQGSSIR
jgi:hypothetical protein